MVEFYSVAVRLGSGQLFEFGFLCKLPTFCDVCPVDIHMIIPILSGSLVEKSQNMQQLTLNSPKVLQTTWSQLHLLHSALSPNIRRTP